MGKWVGWVANKQPLFRILSGFRPSAPPPPVYKAPCQGILRNTISRRQPSIRNWMSKSRDWAKEVLSLIWSFRPLEEMFPLRRMMRGQWWCEWARYIRGSSAPPRRLIWGSISGPLELCLWAVWERQREREILDRAPLHCVTYRPMDNVSRCEAHSSYLKGSWGGRTVLRYEPH